ncbi:hypothetical protein Scep_016869 [Stephania cephalantha]|uniref:Uncharacterized protein n=1 Tax=Stephania cephalantha TaxID=152367 RepID=A0AAP0INJ7_9MAGN
MELRLQAAARSDGAQTVVRGDARTPKTAARSAAKRGGRSSNAMAVKMTRPIGARRGRAGVSDAARGDGATTGRSAATTRQRVGRHDEPAARRRDATHRNSPAVGGGGERAARGDDERATAWSRRDERRGGALSTCRMRDFDEIATTRWRVRDPVEYTDKNNDLVMHRDKDIDMFHLDWDFNVPVWAYGQPGTAEPETYSCYCHVRMLPWHILMGGDRWCVLCLEVSEEPGLVARGAQLVTEEPNPTE